MKILADQLKADRICAPLKAIPAAVVEAINKLQTAETINEQLALLHDLHRYVENKIVEAQKEI